MFGSKPQIGDKRPIKSLRAGYVIESPHSVRGFTGSFNEAERFRLYEELADKAKRVESTNHGS